MFDIIIYRNYKTVNRKQKKCSRKMIFLIMQQFHGDGLFIRPHEKILIIYFDSRNSGLICFPSRASFIVSSAIV